MLCCSWDMTHDTCNLYFSFWAIFVLLPPNSPKKSKFQKNEKKCQEISSFYTCVPKVMIRWCKVLRYGVQQRDEQMEKVTEVGAPPKNFILITFVCLKVEKLKLKKSSRFWNFWHYYFEIHFFPSKNHLAFLTIDRHDIELPNIKISDKNFVLPGSKRNNFYCYFEMLLILVQDAESVKNLKFKILLVVTIIL